MSNSQLDNDKTLVNRLLAEHIPTAIESQNAFNDATRKFDHPITKDLVLVFASKDKADSAAEFLFQHNIKNAKGERKATAQRNDMTFEIRMSEENMQIARSIKHLTQEQIDNDKTLVNRLLAGHIPTSIESQKAFNDATRKFDHPITKDLVLVFASKDKADSAAEFLFQHNIKNAKGERKATAQRNDMTFEIRMSEENMQIARSIKHLTQEQISFQQMNESMKRDWLIQGIELNELQGEFQIRKYDGQYDGQYCVLVPSIPTMSTEARALDLAAKLNSNYKDNAVATCIQFRRDIDAVLLSNDMVEAIVATAQKKYKTLGIKTTDAGEMVPHRSAISSPQQVRDIPQQPIHAQSHANATTSTQKPPYEIVISEETFHKIQNYKQKLEKSPALAGEYLRSKLPAQGKLSQMSDEQFIELILSTKKPKIFAESAIRGGGQDWNNDELSILGDINVKVPNVTIYDNGAWGGGGIIPDTNKRHETPFEATLLFTPGALLKKPGEFAGEKTPDQQEVTNEDNSLNIVNYKKLVKRRLLPLFQQANEDSAHSGYKGLVTVPGIGCGAFAGKFSGKLEPHFTEALHEILEEPDYHFDNIAGVYCNLFNPKHNKAPEMIKNVKFMVDSIHPQLCAPETYGAEFKNCKLFKAVAWDHVSLPGNDGYDGTKITDDGMVGHSTNLFTKITHTIGEYDKSTAKYYPLDPHNARLPIQQWEKIATNTPLKVTALTLKVINAQAKLIDHTQQTIIPDATTTHISAANAVQAQPQHQQTHQASSSQRSAQMFNAAQQQQAQPQQMQTSVWGKKTLTPQEADKILLIDHVNAVNIPQDKDTLSQMTQEISLRANSDIELAMRCADILAKRILDLQSETTDFSQDIEKSQEKYIHSLYALQNLFIGDHSQDNFHMFGDKHIRKLDAKFHEQEDLVRSREASGTSGNFSQKIGEQARNIAGNIVAVPDAQHHATPRQNIHTRNSNSRGAME